MDWKSNLRCTQSLKSVSSSCKLSWTESRLQDKVTSVSQLVARFQNTSKIIPMRNMAQKSHQTSAFPLNERALLDSQETSLEALMRKNNERLCSRVKTNFSHNEAMGSLRNSNLSIETLKAVFESKAASKIKVRSFKAQNITASCNKSDILLVINRDVDEEERVSPSHEDFVTDTKCDREPKASKKVLDPTRTRSGGLISKSVKLLRLRQNRSPRSGERVNIMMAEDKRQKTEDHPPAPTVRIQPGSEEKSGALFQQFMPPHSSKEMLHQQRQKCELRRLLKHTHPELKMLDEVVNEELAEVLSSETWGTAAETGYEGEVLSRRLMFENCSLSNKVSPCNRRIQMADKTVGKGAVSKASAVFEQPEKGPHAAGAELTAEGDKTHGCVPDLECEDEGKRIDVQAPTRTYECQSLNASPPNMNKKQQAKVSVCGNGQGAFQKQKQESEMQSKNLQSYRKECHLDLTAQPPGKGSCVVEQGTDQSLYGGVEDYTHFGDELSSCTSSEGFKGTIETSAALFQNNPFIAQNVEREHSYDTTKPGVSAEDRETPAEYPTASVRNRTHLFESMSFNKLRHQNMNGIEAMVEEIKESLNSLYLFKALHSNGSIIEVNEMMVAKKVAFTLSEEGPEIKYDEVAQGSSQNFLLHLLPRANLKPQIVYLKEELRGKVEATVVKVPVHQDQMTTSQDAEFPEFKTAKIVQLLEDILNQDNSLRKGVIIQEGNDRCADVIVYSLYNYLDEGDVRRYHPPLETNQSDEAGMNNPALRTRDLQSSTNLLSAQTCTESATPDFTVKGNVELFKNCIEKGDFEYLKSLRAESTIPIQEDQDTPRLQHLSEQGVGPADEAAEWVPVDINKLRSMFSGDKVQVKLNNMDCKTPPQVATISPAFSSQKASTGESKSSMESNIEESFPGEEEDNTRDPQDKANTPIPFPCEMQVDESIQQAELIHLDVENDGLLNLQNAIHCLQQATTEAKSFLSPLREEPFCLVQEASASPCAPVKMSDASSFETQTTVAELLQNGAEKEASNITSEPDISQEKTGLGDADIQTNEIVNKKGQNSTKVAQMENAVVSSNSCGTAAQQEEEEVVFQAGLKAALDSLEKSNVNISRGDFKAAMIYRKSSKSTMNKSQDVSTRSAERTTRDGFCVPTDQTSAQASLSPNRASGEMTGNVKLLPQSESLTLNTLSVKGRRSVCPKPTIPPKPEHLKLQQNNRDSISTESRISKPKTMTGETENTSKDKNTYIPTTYGPNTDEEDAANANGCKYLVRHERNTVAPQISHEFSVKALNPLQGSVQSTEREITDISHPRDEMVQRVKKSVQNLPAKGNTNTTDDSHVDFNEARQRFDAAERSSMKNAPVKPKRVKIAKTENQTTAGENRSDIPLQQTALGPSSNGQSGQAADARQRHEREIKQDGKVEMREKKGKAETEDELRRRLSVHMDEIMRGNITAAMEIFDNLRKQEELQSILSRVEEIEDDTSKVDVRSLRNVFENVPNWVVDSGKKEIKRVRRVEALPFLKDKAESRSPVDHVFGDLERASEEIMNLKEQTLARLIDIEGAIKKALYSISALKSDADIAGLSYLLKESLGTQQAPPNTGSISRISIGSSRTKSELTQEGSPARQAIPGLTSSEGTCLDVTSVKQRASPSPAFITIQSAARKTNQTELPPPLAEGDVCPTCQWSPRMEGTFQTTKTLMCNSPVANRKADPEKGSPKQELSVLQLQTDREGNSILGSETVTENSKRTDTDRNRFYSSETANIVATQPDAIRTSSQFTISPTADQANINSEDLVSYL